MPGSGDIFAFLLIIVLLALWGGTRLRRWLHAAPHSVPQWDRDEIPESLALELLEEAGYEVLSGKTKIPIRIELDEEQLESRLFIDFFARDGKDVYVVKVSRHRSPMEFTGSSIRDRLLFYHLLYENAAGILYVDLAAREVRTIRFEIDID